MATQTEMATTTVTTDDASGAYGASGDVAVADLLGMKVLVDGDGDIGEIEDLVRSSGEVMAVVGVGGFLGLGEHDVALPLAEFT